MGATFTDAMEAYQGQCGVVVCNRGVSGPGFGYGRERVYGVRFRGESASAPFVYNEHWLEPTSVVRDCAVILRVRLRLQREIVVRLLLADDPKEVVRRHTGFYCNSHDCIRRAS